MDAELWELCGHCWRLPLHVNEVRPGLFEVRLAPVPMLRKQREAAHTGLGIFSQHREGDVWFFSKAGLEKSAIKSSFTDPEDVVVWKHTENEEEVAPCDFVHAYCKSRDAIPLPQFQNPATFAVIWNSICNALLDHLIIRGAEVDFGFAKLSAVCARANWKSIIIGRVVARRRNGISMDAEATRREVLRHMRRDFMTACSNGETVRWTLEITPQKKFHAAVETVELRRKREQRGSYASTVLKLLKSHTHRSKLYRILDAYWRETEIPCAKLPHGFPPTSAESEGTFAVQPAPKPIPTPIVDGAAVTKNRRVNLEGA